MVSTSTAQQPNALIVSNPLNQLIITSSSSTHLTPTSITAQNTMAQSANQQSFLQLLQNQQRPFLYSPQQLAPQMFLSGHNRLLAPKTSNGTNSSPQTVFIDPNLLAQQQIRTKPIIIPGQHAANLQSRSHILSGLQTNGFLPITWPPTPPIFIPPQSSPQQLFLHTPLPNQPAALQTPILVPHQNGTLLVRAPSSNDKPEEQTPTVQSTTVQPTAVQSTTVQLNAKESNKKTAKKKTKETLDESSLNGASLDSSSNESDGVQILDNDELKRLKKDQRKLLTRKNEMSNRMIRNNEQTKQEKLSKGQYIHKSTQQMNDELLLKKEKFDEIDKILKNSKGKKFFGKQEKKRNVSIVKPRVLLTHNVSGYLIHESDKPSPVDDFKVDEVLRVGEKAPTKADEPIDVQTMIASKVNDEDRSVESPKLKKQKKVKKSKSLNSENSINISSQKVEITQSPQQQQSDPIETKSGTSISEWSKHDVHEFLVSALNKEFADALLKEEFTGTALTLPTIPILRTFNLKLGPILSLIKKIEELNAKSVGVENKWDKSNIYEWSVKDTYEFILDVATKENAEEFKKQEIDGFSLTLISEDTLRKDLNVAYGPSMVIIDKINKLKAKAQNS